VIPMRRFLVLLLMLVIVIELVRSARTGLEQQMKMKTKRKSGRVRKF
jgi:hypothetical protein